MPQPKKRRKAYRPKPVNIPDIVQGYLNPSGQGLRLDGDIKLMLIVDALEKGEHWTSRDLGMLSFALDAADLLAYKTDVRVDLHAAFLLGAVAVELVHGMHQPSSWIPPHLTGPIRNALQLSIEVERLMSGTEMAAAENIVQSRPFQRTARDRSSTLCAHINAVRVVEPETPWSWKDLDAYPDKGMGFWYVHNRVEAGHIVQIDGRPFLKVADDDRLIEITDLTLGVLAKPHAMTVPKGWKVRPAPKQPKEVTCQKHSPTT